MKVILLSVLSVVILLHSVTDVHAGTYLQPKDNKLPEQLKDVGIVENLGVQVDTSLKFTNEEGKEVPLSSFLHTKKPVVLTLMYYECPSLCNLLLNGFVDTLKNFPQWEIGKQYEIITISIDPREGPELASRKKQSYLKSLGRADAEAGWHFLTGKEESIKKLSTQVGFRYKFDEKQKEYAHGAGLFILTPEGKLSRVLYGIQFQSKDLKLALLEASSGKIGTVIDRILMFCYRYDPTTRGYGVYAMRLVQITSATSVAVFGGVFFIIWRSERRKGRKGLKVDG